MRTAIIVSVTETGELELPPEFKAQLKPGDEYIVWQTEDSILLKKLQKPKGFVELWERIEELGADPNQPSLEEISEMVKEVRRGMSQNEGAS